MRILLSIEHPAWAHQFRYVIKELEKKGHEVKVVAINKDHDLELLKAFNIPYEIISNSSGKNIVEKGIIFLWTTLKILLIALKFKPDMFIGRASPMMAINSFIFRKPHIIFEDTEHSTFCLTLCKYFSDVIMTPICFTKDIGPNQIRVAGYKELFYLHPNYFKPNLDVLKDVNVKPDEKFIIIRFVAWDAHHDIGQYGIRNKIGLIKALESYGRVFITSEGSLPSDLEGYRITILPERLHDLLYFATLHLGEGGTTATEAAVLGTPSIFVSSLSGTMGNFRDLELNYDLMYSYINDNDALKKAKNILQDPISKKKWILKREQLIREKIDVTAFLIWFIDNYPRSVAEMTKHLEAQHPCSPPMIGR